MFPLRVALTVSSSLHRGEANSRRMAIVVEVEATAGDRDEVVAEVVLLEAEGTAVLVDEELIDKAAPSPGVASPLQEPSNTMVAMAALATGRVANLITTGPGPRTSWQSKQDHRPRPLSTAAWFVHKRCHTWSLTWECLVERLPVPPRRMSTELEH